MDISRLLVQATIAVACAAIAASLMPRRVPGKWVGLGVTGFAGVWLSEEILGFLDKTYRFQMPDFVTWGIQGVAILPAIAGSAVILYLVTAFLAWGRYQR